MCYIILYFNTLYYYNVSCYVHEFVKNIVIDQVYKIIINCFIENILDARHRCKLAEQTSDIDGIIQHSKKRRSRKKINFKNSSPSSSEDNNNDVSSVDNDLPTYSSDSDNGKYPCLKLLKIF